MKKVLIGLLTGTLILISSCSDNEKKTIDPSLQLDLAGEQLEKSLKWLGDTILNPRTMEDGSVRLVRSQDWTSGFWPGMLWYIYESTGEEQWKDAAHHFSMNLEQEMYNGGTHDTGFKMGCSFGNGYRLTGNEDYRDILIQSAKTLITRFNPTIGCIRSWDHNTDKWDYPVIIDNMMNIELLFWATKETGDSIYYDVAIKHAETTLRNHFRDDHSSFHVVSYDTLNGEVVKKNTHQGFAHESAWARGQAWGLYGYTMSYRETGREEFLEQAIKIAEFILDHPNLPEDKVPYWDYDAPGKPDIPRDVSAAAITASALYELAGFSMDKKAELMMAADQILTSLSSDYRLSGDHSWPFLLDHSTGNMNKDSEVDVPIIYADYYYVEALMRKKSLMQE